MIYVWIALIVFFLLVEAGTVAMVSLWFAGGAFAGMIACLLGGGPWLQISIFLAVSLALLILFLPAIKKRQSKKAIIPTNADRIIGMKALVTEPIDFLQGKGAVKADGKVWSAKLEESDSGVSESIPEGALVEILRIEGAKVIVRKV